MPNERSSFDRFLMRAKDIGFLLGIIGAMLVWSGNWSAFPSRLEASEKEIVQLKNWNQKTDLKLATMEQDIKYIVKWIDEQKVNERRRQ